MTTEQNNYLNLLQSTQLSASKKLEFKKAIAKYLGLLFTDDDPVWSTSRHVIITGGYRAGKSTRGAFKALTEMICNPECRLIWLVGPDYSQAQEEMRMILEWCVALNLIDTTNPRNISMPSDGSRHVVTRTGCRIQTKSAKHPETLASVAPDGIVFCEPGQMNAEVYETALARLAQKRGWLFMCGTLEDGSKKPRWVWYEKLAVDWYTNPDGGLQKSYRLPSWTNRIIYPGGYDDPEMQMIRNTVSEFKWARMYGGEPFGVEHPVFPLLWEPSSKNELILPTVGMRFTGGAIGVDYGFSFEHPSAIVVVQEDYYGNYWIREAWQGWRVDRTELESVVHAMQENYDVWQGCVDPNQQILGQLLNFQVAAGGSTGGKPSEMRISLTNGILEQRQLFFDLHGNNIDEVWDSMAICRRIPNSKGQLVYERPLGDDLAQAVMYAMESLRGQPYEPLVLEQSTVSMTYQHTATDAGGSI